MSQEDYLYRCQYVDSLSEQTWAALPPVFLARTVDGEDPRLTTQVRTCWTRDSLFIQFVCEDDNVLAAYTQRDDPLYEQDVVEVFIDTVGDGTNYLEFEISPTNVIFDACIENDLKGNIAVHKEWNADGLRTKVTENVKSELVYEIEIPNTVFSTSPDFGVEWRVNFYRIDYEKEGKRHLFAWSPTGRPQFHTPNRFGKLVFV